VPHDDDAHDQCHVKDEQKVGRHNFHLLVFKPASKHTAEYQYSPEDYRHNRLNRVEQFRLATKLRKLLLVCYLSSNFDFVSIHREARYILNFQVHHDLADDGRHLAGCEDVVAIKNPMRRHVKEVSDRQENRICV